MRNWNWNWRFAALLGIPFGISAMAMGLLPSAESVSGVYLWGALGSMIAMQVILGMDNIAVASAIAGRLPPAQQYLARKLGLVAATGSRILLLVALTQLEDLRSTLFTVVDHDFSGRDLLFLSGGLYLLFSSTREIQLRMEGVLEESARLRVSSLPMAVVQIAVVDLLVSVDNVVTLIGMSSDSNLLVMIAALLLSGLVLLVAERPMSEFVSEHQSVRVLTLGLIVLIGMAMVWEGMGVTLPKAYIYFAIGFAVMLEMINLEIEKTTGQR